MPEVKVRDVNILLFEVLHQIWNRSPPMVVSPSGIGGKQEGFQRPNQGGRFEDLSTKCQEIHDDQRAGR